MIRYHCFISYTNREAELRELRPLLDVFGSAFRSLGVVQAPVFWDRFEMDGQWDAERVSLKLLEAIGESVCMLAFVSPPYLTSPWCVFEWGAMAGVHLNRGQKWPVIRPYVWQRIRSTTRPKTFHRWLRSKLLNVSSEDTAAPGSDFVEQVPCKIIDIDVKALVEYQPLPWKPRNPFAEYLHHQEERKLSELVGDALGFIAEKYAELDGAVSGELREQAGVVTLSRMSEELLNGRSVEDVAYRYVSQGGL